MALSIFKQFAICVKSRKEAIIIYSWLSIIGLFITCRGFPPMILLLKVFFAMTGTALGVYFYNDICDLDDDIVSGEFGNLAPSSRPLGRGLVSKSRLGVFSALMCAFGLMSSALINLEVLLIQFAFLVLGFIYSTEPIRLKRIFLMKQVTVVIGGAIACLSAGLAVGTVTVHLLYLTGLYVLFTLGLNPIGDLKDIESDQAGGIKTIPIVWGPEFTIRLALATVTAAAVSTWVGFYGLGFNIALPILGTTVLAALAYVVYPLLGRWGDREYILKTVYSWFFPLYFLLQLVVLVGSIPV